MNLNPINQQKRKSMLNKFQVEPNFNYVRISNIVDSTSPFANDLWEIQQELLADGNLKCFTIPSEPQQKLHRMWVNFKGDKSKVSYYWDNLKAGHNLHNADKGCATFGQGTLKITPDVKEMWRLMNSELPFLEATLHLGWMKFQVEYSMYSLPNLNPYTTNIDFVCCKDGWDNWYGDFTNSAYDTNLIPKMIELLMLAGNVADGLITYNLVLGKGYIYQGHNPRLLAMCKELYKKFINLRNQQEINHRL